MLMDQTRTPRQKTKPVRLVSRGIDSVWWMVRQHYLILNIFDFDLLPCPMLSSYALWCLRREEVCFLGAGTQDKATVMQGHEHKT